MPATTPLSTRDRQAEAYRLRQTGMAFRVIAEELGWDRPQQAHAAVSAHARRIGDDALITRRTTVTAAQAMWMSGGTFGVELECVGISRDQAADAVTAVLGYRPPVVGYHGTADYSRWSSQYDGSLQSPNGLSCELVSPVLSGADGFAELEAVMAALTAAGASVNRSCGTHVHHGVDHLDGAQMSLLVENLFAVQPALNSLVARSRRRGMYPGRPMREAQVADVQRRIAGATDEAAWKRNLGYYANGSDRYTRFNFTKFTVTGTVEFRQHQGTLDSNKLVRWVRLGQAIIEASARGISLPRGTTAPLRALRNAGLLTADDVAWFATRRDALRG